VGSQASFAPEVEVHFKVFGDFDPEEVSRVTGLTPTVVRRRGERLGRSRSRAAEDSWRLILGPVATLEGTDQITRMLDIIEPVSDALIKLREDRGLVLQITLVAYVPPHRAAAVPNVSLDRGLLERVVKAGVQLDFDFMLLSEDEPEQASPPEQ
jgi:hypothetical protein